MDLLHNKELNLESILKTLSDDKGKPSHKRFAKANTTEKQNFVQTYDKQ